MILFHKSQSLWKRTTVLNFHSHSLPKADVETPLITRFTNQCLTTDNKMNCLTVNKNVKILHSQVIY